jgi:hypothetical protein
VPTPRRPLLLTLLLALVVLLAPAAAVASPEPHRLLRYWGDASSATGAALGAGECDLNGDGFDDAVVGAWFWDKAPNSNVGAAYVLFGGAEIAGGDLETPAEADAVRIDGPGVDGAFTGFSVACAGDVNGDGIDDLALSHYVAEKAYVVLGAEDFGSVDLSNLGDRGYEIRGDATEALDYNVGFSMAPAGDVNDDGFDDIAIAGVVADTRSRTNNGRVWIVAGKEGVANVDVINPAPGAILQTIDGPQNEARLGSIAPAGDVNGDGTDDVVLGAYTATPHGSGVAVPGQAWVLFGGGDSEVDLADVGGDGFTILGPTRQRDRLGISVAGAGDVDGDGHDDLLIGGDGVSNATTGERDGSAWVVRGAASNETVHTDASGTGPSVYDCADDDSSSTCDPGEKSSRGYWIVGADTEAGTASESTGYSLSGIGDVNADDVPDFAIGAYGYDPVNPANPSATMSGAGAVYLVYGKDGDDSTQQLGALGPDDGYRIDGLAAGDRFGRQVAAIGDADGNGSGDLAVGADFAARPLAPATPRAQAGEVTLALLGLPGTETTLEATRTQLAVGETTDLTAQVQVPIEGEAAAAGTVAFRDGDAPIEGCGSVPVSEGGSASCAGVTLGVGAHELTAVYEGGGELADSTSEPLAVTVAEAPKPPDPPTGAAGRIDAAGPIVQIGGGGRATLAMLTCERGPCAVEATAERLRVGRKRFSVVIETPGEIETGRTIAVRVQLGKDARKALRKRGRGFLNAGLGVTGDGDPVSEDARFTIERGSR